MSAALEIATKLQSAGLGTIGSTIFVGSTPPSPASCLTTFERAGRSPVRTMGTIVCVQPHVYVESRDADYETAHAKSIAVRTALQNFVGLIGSVYYYEITAMGDIGAMGVDENDRYRFTQTFLVTKAS